jgi:hypothetical protein
MSNEPELAPIPKLTGTLGATCDSVNFLGLQCLPTPFVYNSDAQFLDVIISS